MWSNARMRAVGTMVLALPMVLAGWAEARLVRLEITSRQVVADGTAFGETGPYEKLLGTAFFEVDPDDPRNAQVLDLDKAPHSSRGLVTFSADFYILKPVGHAEGKSRALLRGEQPGQQDLARPDE